MGKFNFVLVYALPLLSKILGKSLQAQPLRDQILEKIGFRVEIVSH